MEKEDLLKLLKEDVAKFNEYRTDAPREPAVDFSGVDLRGSQLPGANLGGILLSKADLRETDLREASLGGADLKDADLRGADLTGATLHRADMWGADLRGAKLGGFNERGRICIHTSCFEQVHYDKNQLAQILEVLNLNQDWVIRYEIVPKNS